MHACRSTLEDPTYRLALTYELTAELSDSSAIRVLPYDRVLQILRRFRAAGPDISSRDAMQALASESGARFVIVPTLLYEGGAWRARMELRDAQTATATSTFDTPPVVSSLLKETTYALMPALAVGVQRYFVSAGPIRASLAMAIRGAVGRAPAAPALQTRTLDAAAGLEQAIDAYERLELDTSLGLLTRSAQDDPRNPLLSAWRGRVARLMRQDGAAIQAADEAERLLTNRTPPAERLFIEAMDADARGDAATADARYRALAARDAGDARWVIELAAFQDRRGFGAATTAEAISGYLRALELDPKLVRPHLELCRLYNRSNEAAQARLHAQRALTAYQAAGDRGGEAQTLLCLTDMLRVGGDAERREARQYADAALAIFTSLGARYNLARAHHYVALIAQAERDPARAAASWDLALAAAKDTGNKGLESVILTNLGAANSALGNIARALELYQQSYVLFEALGNDQGGAFSQANAAALLVQYGDPERGFRDIQNALAVVRKLNDKNFEVFCLEVSAAYYRNDGRQADAERELNQALAIARERNRDTTLLTIDLARSRFDMGNYGRARELLVQALGNGSGPRASEARLLLARTEIRLGNYAAAEAELARAADTMEQRGDIGLSPLLHLARGELAYERGALADAIGHFERSSALWKDDLPDEASVEGRANLALLTALGGRPDPGRILLERSLAQARKMGRLLLATRARIHLARLAIRDGRRDEALAVLRDVPTDSSRTPGPELEAQVHYWRAQALAGLGRRDEADAERLTARTLMQQLRDAIPEPDRAGFAARPDVRATLG